MPSETTAPPAAPSLRCRFCPGREFRRSRLRLKDILTLLLFRYPVRCIRCRRRQKIGLSVAMRLESSKARISPTPPPPETWRTWTEGRSVTPELPDAPIATPRDAYSLAHPPHLAPSVWPQPWKDPQSSANDPTPADTITPSP